MNAIYRPRQCGNYIKTHLLLDFSKGLDSNAILLEKILKNNLSKISASKDKYMALYV